MRGETGVSEPHDRRRMSVNLASRSVSHLVHPVTRSERRTEWSEERPEQRRADERHEG